MKRIEAIEIIAKRAEDVNALLVANIGFPSRELYFIFDRKENFYMLGSMGLASSIGLGLALARPDKRVIAIDGDGSVLMNMGSLATIANQHPENYILVIIDNSSYGSTGSQPTATSGKTNLASVAKGAGIESVYDISNPDELKETLSKVDSGVILVRVPPGNEKVPIIPLSPEEIIERFMEISSD
ncbi:sulfopyruvate decarboxylase subunit beta [Methanohalophilus levihalophilus]|uniref:sulfopyruvate decarboxylase subunit beta n=1 Tax=Methanohalophilus levihalophilus TaxID=1431282 RepID=UPI001AE70C71|nr:sulfopyruvate decarboxylase subunit beta [Methanohalophilus levihalophilus]MBP2030778.1 sulfopyruvate decarboxylase subunit beta [Methanohalophilus levihalophilus]